MLPGAAGLKSILRSPEYWLSRVPGVGWGFIYSWVKRQEGRAENPVQWPQGRPPSLRELPWRAWLEDPRSLPGRGGGQGGGGCLLCIGGGGIGVEALLLG